MAMIADLERPPLELLESPDRVGIGEEELKVTFVDDIEVAVTKLVTVITDEKTDADIAGTVTTDGVPESDFPEVRLPLMNTTRTAA